MGVQQAWQLAEGGAAPFPDCGVCFERGRARLSAPGCGHALCVGCAVGLAASDARPPRCPFCRVEVFRWERTGGEEKRRRG